MARWIRSVCVAAGAALLFVSSMPAMGAGAARPSITTLSVSPDHATREGDDVTLSAVVAPIAAEDGEPGGTVEFFDGMTSLGSSPLSADHGRQVARVTWSAVAGSHSLTARYSGDLAFAASASLPVLHAVASRQG